MSFLIVFSNDDWLTCKVPHDGMFSNAFYTIELIYPASGEYGLELLSKA